MGINDNADSRSGVSFNELLGLTVELMKFDVLVENGIRKYPWKELVSVGDYFDAPEGTNHGTLKNLAAFRSDPSGSDRRFMVTKLRGNQRSRVMLVEAPEMHNMKHNTSVKPA